MEIDTQTSVQVAAPVPGIDLAQQLGQVERERDEYKKLYISTLELCRKLERGILGQQRERFAAQGGPTTMSLLELLLGKDSAAVEVAVPPPAEPEKQVIPEHKRAKPTGRKPIPENLPRVDVELLPLEVQKAGLDAFHRIGEDVTETVERRQASLVVVRITKPKFVLKTRDRLESTTVHQAEPLELPIERGLAGPGLLADTIVRRWQDHLPLHRLERIYAREGYELPRSTVCGWHAELAALAAPLLAAMWKDALTAPYLCTDATGVLVQHADKCRNGHFWVVADPGRHVLFAYSASHDSAAVDDNLKGYKGYLVADAHSVYDHLYATGDVVEVGCWAHARRYFFKSLSTDPVRANQALTLIRELFKLERVLATATPEERLRQRKSNGQRTVDGFFAWCDIESAKVLDQTPISKAINYARNQREALHRFLQDARLPLHNNFSERELRREALGRNAWLFIGNDDAGEVNATFVSLLASCQLHKLEPWSYLRDLLCLLPSWPVSRILELAPVNWQKTLENGETQQKLAANVFRQAALGTLK